MSQAEIEQIEFVVTVDGHPVDYFASFNISDEGMLKEQAIAYALSLSDDGEDVEIEIERRISYATDKKTIWTLTESGVWEDK